MWVNELCNINLKFKNTKENYDKDKNKLKAHVFDVLTEEYKPLRVSCNVNIEKM